MLKKVNKDQSSVRCVCLCVRARALEGGYTYTRACMHTYKKPRNTCAQSHTHACTHMRGFLKADPMAKRHTHTHTHTHTLSLSESHTHTHTHTYTHSEREACR